jgi:osmoprotectant transport system permease protein
MNVVSEAFDLLSDADTWTGPNGILERLRAHLWISLVATALAALIAVPTAVLLAHRRWAPIFSVAVVNVSRAIPSFAVIALVLPISIKYGFGLGFWPTCLALVLLAIPPMFTNTYIGVAGTPAASIDAARGLGMTGGDVLRKVELPTAVPLIAAGVRISSVQVVATATLGALVGYECLGTYIVAGLARGRAGYASVLIGALLVATVALGIDAILSRVEPRFAPWAKRVR